MPWTTLFQTGWRVYTCSCAHPAPPSASCYRCVLCAQDMCANCVHRDVDHTGYCPRCWLLGEPYRVQIDAALRQYDLTVGALIEAWREAALKETNDEA